MCIKGRVREKSMDWNGKCKGEFEEKVTREILEKRKQFKQVSLLKIYWRS